MARYDFKCNVCDAEREVSMPMSMMEAQMALHCPCCSSGGYVITPHTVQLGIPSIGAVPGGGGSPAR